MNNIKSKQYLELVKKRKQFEFNEVQNPSNICNGIYDIKDSIGPWSLWLGNIDADILVIGQDWGDVDYYLNNKGVDNDNNPTNRNLIKLFKEINIDIGIPSKPNKNAKVFLTNAILGIKKNGMSSEVKVKWEKESTENFLKPLIDIIQPKVIITLGKIAFGAVARIYNLKKENMSKLVEKSPILIGNKKIFPMYHCGSLGIRNRSLEMQKQDWRKVKF